MSRSSRSFSRRLFYACAAVPITKFLYDRRDWFQSLELAPERQQQQQQQQPQSFETDDPHQEDLLRLASSAERKGTAQSIRNKKIEKLDGAHVDVLVVGGGATGLFAALDASSRGLSVALVEQSDFGSGATGSGTRLLHCGMKRVQTAIRQRDWRELQQMVYDIVETRALVRCATPSSSSSSSSSSNENRVFTPMPTLTPISSFTEWIELASCAAIFTLGSILGGMPQLATLKLPSAITREYCDVEHTETDMLYGALKIPEQQIDGHRLCQGLAHTAAKHGANVVNYARLVGFDCEERPPRGASSAFHALSSRQLQKRKMHHDGQPYPTFETASTDSHFFEEQLPKRPPKRGDEDEFYEPETPKTYDKDGVEQVGWTASTATYRRSILPAAGGSDDSGLADEDRPFYAVHAAVVRDELSGKMLRVYPSYVMNCTGVTSDSVRRMFPVALPQLFERFSAQFFLAAHHADPRVASATDNGQKKEQQPSPPQRKALLSARNHVDAKALFVFPFATEDGNTRNWSLLGPVDMSIIEDSKHSRWERPETTVVTGDPARESPSLWRDLLLPRISMSDLVFCADAADVFGVHVDRGFALVQPRALTGTWPGSHAPLARALRFGGAVDYRTMHQRVVHSVGTEVQWARKKAELMVDSFFIEKSRDDSSSRHIPRCRTKKLAIDFGDSGADAAVRENLNAAFADGAAAGASSSRRRTEADIRYWARTAGCATVLDALLRHCSSPTASTVGVLCDAMLRDKAARDAEIERIAKVLAEEWQWTGARQRSEVDAARRYFERNSFGLE